MPRRPRIASGGLAYHVLNRAVGRAVIFESDSDYQAMLRIIERTHRLIPIRIITHCLMPNHWHLVLWPDADGQLSEFMRLLTVTHTQRRHAHRHTAGDGPLYQGRFKSFPIQEDDHLLTVCRYVERNPLRANLVATADAWPWAAPAARSLLRPPAWLLPTDRWPTPPPADWPDQVNRPQTQPELDALRQSVQRGRPYGDTPWQDGAARHLGLEHTLRPRGRPRIRPIKDSRPL